MTSPPVTVWLCWGTSMHVLAMTRPAGPTSSANLAPYHHQPPAPTTHPTQPHPPTPHHPLNPPSACHHLPPRPYQQAPLMSPRHHHRLPDTHPQPLPMPRSPMTQSQQPLQPPPLPLPPHMQRLHSWPHYMLACSPPLTSPHPRPLRKQLPQMPTDPWPSTSAAPTTCLCLTRCSSTTRRTPPRGTPTPGAPELQLT
jgi:hypothetical protein